MRRQIVLCFTQNVLHGRVDSFISELRSSVDKRVRGEIFIFTEHMCDYKINTISRRILINLR